jgi:hypothetical protein
MAGGAIGYVTLRLDCSIFANSIARSRHPVFMTATFAFLLAFALVAAVGSLGVLIAYLYSESKR